MIPQKKMVKRSLKKRTAKMKKKPQSKRTAKKKTVRPLRTRTSKIEEKTFSIDVQA